MSCAQICGKFIYRLSSCVGNVGVEFYTYGFSSQPFFDLAIKTPAVMPSVSPTTDAMMFFLRISA